MGHLGACETSSERAAPAESNVEGWARIVPAPRMLALNYLGMYRRYARHKIHRLMLLPEVPSALKNWTGECNLLWRIECK